MQKDKMPNKRAPKCITRSTVNIAILTAMTFHKTQFLKGWSSTAETLAGSQRHLKIYFLYHEGIKSLNIFVLACK